MPPPDDASQDQEQARARWRAARRAAALAHHPDRGGDADRLQAALAEVDRRFGRPGPGPGAGADRRPPVTVRRTARGRARSLVARLVRRRRPRRTTLR